MNSLPEPHADRTEQPMPTDRDTQAPKHARWPSVLAVAILIAAAAGGMMVTAQQEAKQAGASADKSAPAAVQTGTSNAPQADDARMAQKPR